MKIIITVLILIIGLGSLHAKYFLPVDVAATSVLIKKDGKVIVKKQKGVQFFQMIIKNVYKKPIIIPHYQLALLLNILLLQ